MCLGALYGIGAYTLFSTFLFHPAPGFSGLMLVSFLAGIPFSIGILIGYISRRRLLTGPAGSSVLSVVALGLFIFAAGALLREGTICIVMATPLFLIAVIFGAIIGALVDRFGGPRGSKMLSVALLVPFVTAPVEGDLSPATARQTITQSVYIAAPAQTIWQHINFPLQIRPEELREGFAYRIGVPYPVEARTITGRVGGARELRWQRGVKFEEEITSWEPNTHIAWRYKFGPDSFPPGSLDDHIVIGGRYFNLETTSYTLSPEGDGTRLTIEVGTSVTTNFNWYASLWARFLVDDTAKVILQFYKARSERHAAGATG